jgi:hypothetical protein
MQYDTRARLLAVEVLLADPEALGNDALETDLYLLRDQLTDAAGEPARGKVPLLAGGDGAADAFHDLVGLVLGDLVELGVPVAALV